ncbi:MAG: DUF2321 domain-containing protein [Armatimonadota bacterium]|nr:DUF2321 domain-containing protein [Armatimonadota bacterium]
MDFYDDDLDDRQFDIAQVCLNGHTITDVYLRAPQFNQDCCDKCGERTIINCPNCKAELRGMPMTSEYFGNDHGTPPPPARCYKCGEAYPWTKAKSPSTPAIELDGSGNGEQYMRDGSQNARNNDNNQNCTIASRKVFVVHGHDNGAKESVARLLEKIGLEPVILHEKANQGRTLIEKIEHYSDVGFAVVLLTPDDEGHPKSKPDKKKDRARQNVILELGFFFGRLGRKKVCVLYKEGVECPSDIHGIVYLPMDSEDAWKSKLAKEILAAEIDIDISKAI